MPNDPTQSASPEEQQRWKRELEISQLLSLQKSPGFFPGPGAAAGGGGGGAAAGSEMQGVNAAKDLLSGNVSPEEMAEKAAALAIKELLDKVVWPDVLDIFDGSGFVALTILQFWWVCAMLKVKGTFKPTMREHFQIGLATLFEFVLIAAALTLISILICIVTPSCAIDMGRAYGRDLIDPILKLI